MITAYATPKLAVEAIKAGAIDYLAKAVRAGGTAACRGPLRGTLPAAPGKRRACARAAGETYQLDHIIGESPKIGNCGS